MRLPGFHYTITRRYQLIPYMHKEIWTKSESVKTSIDDMASPKTPAVSKSQPWINNPDITREVRKSFDFNFVKLCENCDRLNSHSKRIQENLSTIQTIESQVKAQGEQLIVSEQLMRAIKKETEEDIKRLKSSLEAEKVRNDRLETLLTQSYIAPSDVIVELQQRVDALTNQAAGQKTISEAKMQNINRRLEELTPLIQRSERRSSSDSQKITGLEMKMEHRFETVVINAREELRHDRNDWVKSLESLRNETTEKITKATNDITAAHDVIQSNMNEHTERLNITVEALRSVNQKVKIVARDADETAIESRQATTSMLERLEAVEIACNAFQTDAEIKERLTELERSRDEISHAQSTLTNSLTEFVTREEFLVAADEARANMTTEIHRGNEAVKRALEHKVVKLEERCVYHWRCTGTRIQSMVEQQLSPYLDRLRHTAPPAREPASLSPYMSLPVGTDLASWIATPYEPSANNSSLGRTLQNPANEPNPTTREATHLQQPTPITHHASTQLQRSNEQIGQVHDQNLPVELSSNVSPDIPNPANPRPDIDPHSSTGTANSFQQSRTIPPTQQPQVWYPPQPRPLPQGAHQYPQSIPQPSATTPVSFPVQPPVPPFFRHGAPQARVTEQQTTPERNSTLMEAVHRQAEMGMHMRWTVTGAPEVRLPRARQLQQEGGFWDLTLDD